MSLIIKRIRLVGSKGSEEVNALFDSGATYSCIREDLAVQLGDLVALERAIYLSTAEEGRRIKVQEAVRLDFYLQSLLVSDEFIVIPGLSERVIIGAATLQKWQMVLDFGRDEVILR